MRAIVLVAGQVLTLHGRLDGAGAAAARDALHEAVTTGSGSLVVDLSGVELVDAVGIGVLLGTHRRARLGGRQLVLRGAAPRVGRILVLTRLDRIIPVEEGSQPAA